MLTPIASLGSPPPACLRPATTFAGSEWLSGITLTISFCRRAASPVAPAVESVSISSPVGVAEATISRVCGPRPAARRIERFCPAKFVR